MFSTPRHGEVRGVRTPWEGTFFDFFSGSVRAPNRSRNHPPGGWFRTLREGVPDPSGRGSGEGFRGRPGGKFSTSDRPRSGSKISSPGWGPGPHPRGSGTIPDRVRDGSWRGDRGSRIGVPRVATLGSPVPGWHAQGTLGMAIRDGPGRPITTRSGRPRGGSGEGFRGGSGMAWIGHPTPSWAIPHGREFPVSKSAYCTGIGRFRGNRPIPGFRPIRPGRPGRGSGTDSGPSGEGFRDPPGRGSGAVGEGDPGSWDGHPRVLDRGGWRVDPGIPGMARIGVRGGGSEGLGPSLLMYTCELD